MVQFNTGARNAGANGVCGTLDEGAGATASIILVDAGETTIATFGSTEGMQDPAFDGAAVGTANLANLGSITDPSADAGGTVVAAVFRNQDSTERFRVGVGAGRPLTMTPSTTVNAGDQVSITACAITWPAGTP